MDRITGGERVGNNLFHSFEEFSIPTGAEAIFENAADIENIFTIITGSDASFIDGLLKTQGEANFFLLNPNGIVFGDSARLDVGRSFTATTANSIVFADGTKFGVNDSNQKPLLTINQPVGLEFWRDNGSITVNGSGHRITSDRAFFPIEFTNSVPNGLWVNNNQTLALIGNEINFNGGVIATEGSQTYLISADSGKVGINQGGNKVTFLTDEVNSYQDINLNQQSLIYANGQQIETISLIGNNINFTEASFLLVQNRSDFTGGSINIKAAESLNLLSNSSGRELFSNIRSETFSNESGTSINVSANNLLLKNGGRIQASPLGNGKAGNISIDVSNNSELNLGFVNVLTRGKGNAGNISFSTSQLRLQNPGVITASTLGEGNGGQITINADFIEILGGTTLDTSNITTSSFGTGDAGIITINTGQLILRDRGEITSSSFGTGDAGNLTINASESIEIIGANQLGNSRLTTIVQAANDSTRKIFGLPEVPTGNAGNININTPILNVGQNGSISAENLEIGDGGTLTISADNLKLDESANITAAAESGIGGSITLNTDNFNISNDSQITTTAAGDENGGNITINTSNLNAKQNN